MAEHTRRHWYFVKSRTKWRVWEDDGTKNGRTIAVVDSEEVARLIAAAPALLEALEAIVNYEASPDFSKWAGVIEQARAALTDTGEGR